MEEKKKCAYEKCGKEATTLACGREYLDDPGHPEPAMYCEAHAKLIANEGVPEYRVECPNCKCRFGVN